MPDTSSGKRFEEFTYERLIIPEGWINLTPYELKSVPTEKGQRYTHRKFPSQFNKYFGFKTETILSKNIEPDFVFYHPKSNRVVALEVKSQDSDGSVDEKLQTGGKKLWRLQKLFAKATNMPPENVSYSYLLKEKDFNKPEYADTFYDIHMDKCEYYFVNDDFHFEIK